MIYPLLYSFYFKPILKFSRNQMTKLVTKIQHFLSMIKISHTVFALPFALVAVIIIHDQNLWQISWMKTLFIVIAFTGVRSFSMAINRIADAQLDGLNPRTQNREIPRGTLSTREVWFFAGFSLIVTWVFSFLLNPLAFIVSFPALVLLAGYSYSKRFTWLCHLWLGAVIGMAPLGVYIALTQQLPAEAWILFVTLTCYISGFDILYAIQDIDFDKKMKLFSMPSRLGISRSLWISSVLHLVSIAGFFFLGLYIDAHFYYFTGAIFISFLIFAEHYVVGWGSRLNRDRIPVAFFNFNSAISISFLLFTFLDFLNFNPGNL